MTVVSAKSFPDPSTLPLVADVQYREPFATRAFNRKLRGIVPMGIYKGLLPTPGNGLNVVVTSKDADDSIGTASFDIGELYQVTVLQQTDVTVAIAAGTKKIVVLQAVYEKGLETYQVNSSATTQAAEIALVDFGTALASNQLELATVTVPAGATQITDSMIDLSGRKMQTIGIELSSAIDSDAENVAANSLAIKNAITHLRDSAPEVLNTIGLLAKALNNDPDFYKTINTALTGKMAIDQNGADIEDKAAFLKNLGLIELLSKKAPLESPTFTGSPKAPTLPVGSNSTQMATTAFVQAAIAALVASSPATLDTLKELADALGNDPNFATTITNALAGKAGLNGDSNQTFYVKTNEGATAAVNNTRLGNVLSGFAYRGGDPSQGFAVAGGASANSAVAYWQFQSGSNGNGAWTKIPGGGQWCRTNMTIGAKSGVTWTFPAGFPNAPCILLSAINGSPQVWFTGVGPNNCGIYNNNDGPLNVNLLAFW